MIKFCFSVLVTLAMKGRSDLWTISCMIYLWFDKVSKIYSSWKKLESISYDSIIYFCIFFKDSCILKRLWIFASAHSKSSPIKNPKISVWLVVKNFFKIKENKLTEPWSSKRQEKVKINQATLLYLQWTRPLIFIRKSFILNVVKTEYTLFFFTFTVEVIHKK